MFFWMTSKMTLSLWCIRHASVCGSGVVKVGLVVIWNGAGAGKAVSLAKVVRLQAAVPVAQAVVRKVHHQNIGKVGEARLMGDPMVQVVHPVHHLDKGERGDFTHHLHYHNNK
jgi:hypothetical protein